MTRLRSSTRPSIQTHAGFSGRNANLSSHEIVPSTKIIKLRALKGKGRSPRRGSQYFANHPKAETKSQTYEE